MSIRRIALIAIMTLIVTSCVASRSPSPSSSPSSVVQASEPVQSAGTVDAPTPTRSTATSPSPSENPVSLPAAGALDPGTYFLANPYVDDDPIRSCLQGCADYERIIFTLPDGWATSDGLVHKHFGESDEMAFSAWTVDQVYADPCRWQGSALGPLDEGLAQQRYRGPLPRELTQAMLGGEPARRIDLSVPTELDISTCDDGQFRSWTEWDVVDGANTHHASGQLDTIYIVDVDRRPLVIDASHMPATSQEDIAELEAILASMIIERGF